MAKVVAPYEKNCKRRKEFAKLLGKKSCSIIIFSDLTAIRSSTNIKFSKVLVVLALPHEY